MLTTYSRRQAPPSPLFLLIPLGLLLVLVIFQLLRPAPPLQATTTLEPSVKLGEAQQLPFPAVGAAGLAIGGIGTVGSFNDLTPRPIASITKVMTAYVYLKYHPLNQGERGPTYTTTAQDVSLYLTAASLDQSVVPVTAGTQFSQYEMLQALLIPSANNFANMLAIADAGTIPAFVTKMNAEAVVLGMTNTTYADASGFSDASRSTAADQLILAQVAMQNPVIAEIVGMSNARLPGVGLVTNVNQLVGQDGIAGIKTGTTDGAGSCLLFFARRQVNGQTVDIYGAVLSQPTRQASFDASRRLVNFAATTVQSVRGVTKDQPVASLGSRWGSPVDVVAAEDVPLLLWPGASLESTVTLDSTEAPLAAGDPVGTLTLRLGDQTVIVPLHVAAPLPKPGIFWKLRRLG